MNPRIMLISCTLLISLSLICGEKKRKSPHQKKVPSSTPSLEIPQSASSSSLQSCSESPCTPCPAKASMSRSPSPSHENTGYSDDEYDFVEKPLETKIPSPIARPSLAATLCGITPSNKMLTLIQNPKTDLTDRKTRREIEEGMHRAAQRNDAEQLLSTINALIDGNGEIHDLASIQAAYATLKKAQQETECAVRTINSEAQTQYNAARELFLSNLSRCFLDLYTSLDRIEESRSEKEKKLTSRIAGLKAARINCHRLNARIASSENPYVKEGCDSDDDSGRSERYSHPEKLSKSLRPENFLDVREFQQRAREVQKGIPSKLEFFPRQGFPF